jgi:hypothetical protein
MAKVHVWYKMTGEIVAVGRAVGKASCLPVSGENQSVLELEVEESAVPSLRQTHIVDPLRQAVAKMPSKVQTK